MKAAVLGITGYTGLLLVRLLADHPEVSKILPVSSSRAGERLSCVDPGLGSISCMPDRLLTIQEAAAEKPDVVFAALPHLKSAELCTPFFGNAVVIDLSADFRLKNVEIFKTAYGSPPPMPGLLNQAVYGLPEWYGDKIKKCDIIANPGCYPTAALLPLLPLFKEGIISDKVIINSITGISGAGRKLKNEYLFCELSENVTAYSPGKSHRHSWEIEAELKSISQNASVLFIPHLAPLRRGIATTITADLCGDPEKISEIFKRCYDKAPFIFLRESSIPQTKEVRGTNRCDIGWQYCGDTLMVFSVIDNLMKGASGQAVQNMNIRFGIEETCGLPVNSEL